jgi:hypothetical protein
LKSFMAMGARLAANAMRRKPPGEGLPSDPEEYGLFLAEPRARERAKAIFRAFFTGMEAAFRRPGSRHVPPDSLPLLFHPFFAEGTALGESIARRFLLRPHLSLQDGTFSREEPFGFLRVIGVGFALAFFHPANFRAAWRWSERFGNFGPLLADGYGFCAGLFRWRGNLQETLRELDEVSGPERLCVVSGLGRSLWFRFMDKPEEALRAVKATPDKLGLLGGLGLASTFTFTDELERAYGVASLLSGDEERAFLKGIRIALFVRQRYQDAFLKEEIARQADGTRSRAAADLQVALEAHEAAHEDSRYIYLFHERCLEGPCAAGG